MLCAIVAPDDAAMLTTKRMGLLKAVKPDLRRVAMLCNKKDHGKTMRYEASAEGAKALGLMVQPLGVGEPDDFNDAFAAMDREAPDAILMVSDALTALNRKRVRLPSPIQSRAHRGNRGCTLPPTAKPPLMHATC